MKKSIVVFLMLLSGSMLFSQVSVNTTGNPPDSSAMLDVSSTGRGMLVPRMSATDRDLISNPATGLLIFCTDDNNFYLNRGTPGTPEWTAIHSQWVSNGNNIYYNDGQVSIGTSEPWSAAQLDVRGSGVDQSGIFNLGNSDMTHRLSLSSGREGNPNPYILWRTGDSLKFWTFIEDVGATEVMRITSDGKVGIGTPVSEFRLSVDNDGGILAKGTYNSGETLLTTGEGTRLIWYPRKAAFRAGYVDNLNWDNDSIGNYSVAMGSNSKATGSSATALGANTTASGDRSVAMGNLTTASGINAVAMGKYTNANSFDCLAIGRHNVGGGTADAWVDNDPIFEIGIGTGPSGRNNAVTVLKSGSMGIGTASPEFKLSIENDGGIIAKGTYESGEMLTTSGAGTRLIWYPRKAAFRVGYVAGTNWDIDSIGIYSVALGCNTKAKGSYSTAMGGATKATGSSSTAMGLYTEANGNATTAMGYSTRADSYGSLAVGICNLGGGSADWWIPTDPVFEIGIGTSSANRDNAMTVLKNGSVGIGTASPDSTALVEMSSTTKGFLPPRMTSAEMVSIINPATGLMVFNMDINKPVFYNGTNWADFEGQILNENPCPGTPTVLYSGQTYNTVLIGTQCWLKENLNVGTLIDSLQTMQNDGIIEKYCYRNEEDSCTKYGGLYQWDEMMQYTTTPGVQGICPPGFHVPTDGEWTTLTDYVSSVPDFWCNSDPTYIAKALASTTLWYTSTNPCAVGNNPAENNATGFSALPGGNRYPGGSFDGLGDVGGWWSSTDSGSHAWYRSLGCSHGVVFRDGYYKTGGFSLRCLKD